MSSLKIKQLLTALLERNGVTLMTNYTWTVFKRHLYDNINNFMARLRHRGGYWFIDDERKPLAIGHYLILRSMIDVKNQLLTGDQVAFVTFDHDLGESQPTGYDIAKLLVEKDMDNGVLLPSFSFQVHSQNPVGKANIEGLLNQYLAQR